MCIYICIKIKGVTLPAGSQLCWQPQVKQIQNLHKVGIDLHDECFIVACVLKVIKSFTL